MKTHPWVVLLLCLRPALGGAMASPTPDSESPLPASSWGRVDVDGRLATQYPKADGTLHPGAYASLGLGVDNAR